MNYVEQKRKWAAKVKPDDADKATELLKRAVGNDWAITDFTNSIGAVYGWGSAMGKRVERHVNSSIWTILTDIFDVLRWPSPDIKDQPVSTAAQTMIDNRIERIWNRKQPMTKACLVACIEWLTERIIILEQSSLIASPWGQMRLKRESENYRKILSGLWLEKPVLRGDEVWMLKFQGRTPKRWLKARLMARDLEETRGSGFLSFALMSDGSRVRWNGYESGFIDQLERSCPGVVEWAERIVASAADLDDEASERSVLAYPVRREN